MKWIDTIQDLDSLQTPDDRRKFLLNLICFAACIEGMFFFAAFAYVYFLRSKGLLHGLAAGTNWVFRDESAHMNFAFEVVKKVRTEDPSIFDEAMTRDIVTMLDEAVDCEMQFAEDILSGGVAGLSVADMRQYLEFIADQRLAMLGLTKVYGAKNPFSFMDLQDVQELANFFERRVSAYQVAVAGEVSFGEAF
jgi:ribonucleoside-diphosphate reductase beta chain